MQIKHLHKNIYRSVYRVHGIDEAQHSIEAYKRVHVIESYEKLKAQKCSEQSILDALKTPRSTLYRWRRQYKKYGLAGLNNENKRPYHTRTPQWSSALEQDVLKLRTKYPLYGKYKIAVLLKKACPRTTSVSTVGRILSSLIKRKLVKSVRFYYGHARDKKKRVFTGHAQRWKYGMKADQPGEMIEIDHMVILLTCGVQVRTFQAVCPITKLMVAQTYACATSKVAANFLDLMIKRFPFKIKSAKVDGGSEFMGEFESECKRHQIALYVLPPRSPKYNGHVERSNCTVKYEFYEQYEGPQLLGLIRLQLRDYIEKYNTIRPHQALQYKTPTEYYLALGAH